MTFTVVVGARVPGRLMKTEFAIVTVAVEVLATVDTNGKFDLTRQEGAAVVGRPIDQTIPTALVESQPVQTGSYYALKTESPTNEGFNGHAMVANETSNSSEAVCCQVFVGTLRELVLVPQEQHLAASLSSETPTERSCITSQLSVLRFRCSPSAYASATTRIKNEPPFAFFDFDAASKTAPTGAGHREHGTWLIPRFLVVRLGSKAMGRGGWWAPLCKDKIYNRYRYLDYEGTEEASGSTVAATAAMNVAYLASQLTAFRYWRSLAGPRRALHLEQLQEFSLRIRVTKAKIKSVKLDSVLQHIEEIKDKKAIVWALHHKAFPDFHKKLALQTAAFLWI
ncbi:predicted protein [Pyrenophora tritici-repentis Pt-1C-BFP]|uniref:Uncharacterized protein n=1 Tax=Pyrenophora tritici-repentis (strain Pt-1C-BFP) TaxID=426418 RepID=B2WL72_PYRTR|nr:uncharacterized protein PTRG_10732 [Pyrenophora tritici-repentis Pt-1C-BFP]EDU43782.1 predicted protein [Pyrenophora tritici-repentis Pt-1C-BFP]